MPPSSPRTVLGSGAFGVKAPPSPRNTSKAPAVLPPLPRQHGQQPSSPKQGSLSPSAAGAAAAASSPGTPRSVVAAAGAAAAPVVPSPPSNNKKPGTKKQQAPPVEQQQRPPPPTPPSAESLLPQIRTLIRTDRQHRKAIELLDSAVGSPTFADLPMFDAEYPGGDPPQYSNSTLLELLSLRVECWMALLQFGRALEDISSAMKVDLQSALLRKDFVVPKLKALHDLGDLAAGLQVSLALEVAVQRSGPLLEEVLEWKRKFVLLARKKNEVVTGDDTLSSLLTSATAGGARNTIVIGSRRIASSAPGCRHGCPDREPASFFQMEIAVRQMHCDDGFLPMYRLYTEYDGAKLPWKFWARQELRKAIDSAAVENWKVCRDATRMYLLAVEFDKSKSGHAERFVDAMDTLGRVPNPLAWDTTYSFFKSYDRAMSTSDTLVELLCELSKPFCSCMSEIAELRSRRVGKANNASKSPQRNSESASGSPSGKAATSSSSAAAAASSGAAGANGDTSAYPAIPTPSVSAQIRREKDAVRDATALKEEGNLLFLSRKFHSALKKYDDAIGLLASAVSGDNGGEDISFAPQLSTDLFFNRTAALFELQQYDAVIMACDRAMEKAVDGKNSDRVLSSKILARRGEALQKLGSYEESLLNYTESCDAVESPKIRTKMLECALEIQKRKFNDKSNSNSNAAGDSSDKILADTLAATTTLSRQVPSPGFASCVLVEPNPRRDSHTGEALEADTASNLSITVFPTQVATASPYFADAVPVPIMVFAGFPFAVVPASPNHSFMRHDNTTGVENWFASLATKALSIDADGGQHHGNHNSSDIWSHCGSVLVVRKDFKPVTCAMVTRFFQFLLDLWTVNSRGGAATMEDAVLINKTQRAEIFADAALARKRIVLALKAGKTLEQQQQDAEDDAAEVEAEQQQDASAKSASASAVEPLWDLENNNGDDDDQQDEDCFIGTHVINVWSGRDKMQVVERKTTKQHALRLKEQGDVLYKGRRFRTALLRYDEALMLDPTSPVILFNRAAVLIELHQLELALECCDNALENVSGDEKRVVDKIVARRNEVLAKMGRAPENIMSASVAEAASSVPPLKALKERKRRQQQEQEEQQQHGDEEAQDEQ